MTEQKTMSTLTPAMKIVIGVVAVVVIAGAIVASALVGAGSAPDAAATVAATLPSENQPGRPAPGTVPPGAASTAPAAPTRGPLPQATPTTGSEVLPPTATPNTRLPKVSPAPPLVPGPLPRSAARTGGLVAGYPSRVMGPAVTSPVVSSSIATQGTTMQVTLVAVYSGSRDTITAHYETLWASLGMRRGLTSDGTLVYAGAHESVTLAFGSSGTGNRYTIYGVFRTK
jgi:hypothetical protein